MKKFFARPILKSAVIIFAALSFVTGGSYSAWTSQVKIAGNSFETGTVEIGVTPAASLFNLNNMSPGVWGEKELVVQNSGSLNYNYSISAELTNTDEDGLKLFNALWAEVYDDNQALLAADWLTDLKTEDRLLESGDSENIEIKIKLDDDTDNSYQNLSTSFNLIFDATQALGSEASGQVVINEIAWMGTVASWSDEWIELYNSSDEEVELNGWVLKTIDGDENIDNDMNLVLTKSISSKGYYLIERTNDDTVSDIVADDTGSFSTGLSDAGEQIVLLDDEGKVIDIANGLKEDGTPEPWFAGKKDENDDENDDRRTMERKSWSSDETLPESWADNNGITKNGLDANGDPIFGTPREKNSATP